LNTNFRAKLESKKVKDFAREKERYLRKKNEKIVTAYKLALVMLGINRKSSNSQASRTSQCVVPASPVAITVEDNTTLANSNSHQNRVPTDSKEKFSPSKPSALKPSIENGRVLNSLL
jgi:hypothetical protein